MSHGVQIPMQGIRNQDYLVEALRRLGQEVRVGESLHVKADDGDRQVNILCPQPGREYGIGFFRSKGQFHAFADWFWVGVDEEEFIRRLNQEYQLVATLAELKAQGLSQAGEIRYVEEAGAIVVEIRESPVSLANRGDGSERAAHVQIGPQGALEVEMSGYRGAACEKATESLETLLGPIHKRVYLPERFEEDREGHQIEQSNDLGL